MPVKRTIPYNFGTFFITFTCHRWLPLIEKVNGYDIIYNWFTYLKNNGHYLNGYVIMPNHVHTLVSFIDTNQNINTIIGNGKRFMAYEIIKRLRQADETTLLQQLENNVEAARKANNKQHEVWELSFSEQRLSKGLRVSRGRCVTFSEQRLSKGLRVSPFPSNVSPKALRVSPGRCVTFPEQRLSKGLRVSRGRCVTKSIHFI